MSEESDNFLISRDKLTNAGTQNIVTVKPVVDSKQAMHAPFIASEYCTECSRSLPDYTGAVYAR